MVVLTQAGFGSESFGFLPVPLTFTALDFQVGRSGEKTSMVAIERLTQYVSSTARLG